MRFNETPKECLEMPTLLNALQVEDRESLSSAEDTLKVVKKWKTTNALSGRDWTNMK